MEREFIEITNTNRHNRGQKILIRIEVPSLGLSFHRPDVNDFTVYLYKNGACIWTIVLPNTTASAFRYTVRSYVETNYPNETE